MYCAACVRELGSVAGPVVMLVMVVFVCPPRRARIMMLPFCFACIFRPRHLPATIFFFCLLPYFFVDVGFLVVRGVCSVGIMTSGVVGVCVFLCVIILTCFFCVHLRVRVLCF